MICLDEGLLRAYVDRELPVRQADAVARHVADCADCQARLAAVEENARLTRARLAELAPTGADRPLAPAFALAAFRARNAPQPGFTERLRLGLAAFAQRLSPRRTALAAAPIAVAALLVLTPVGSYAQSALNVFRTQQVATIEIDPATLPQLPGPDELGTTTITGKLTLRNSNLTDAGRAAGLTPLTVRQVPGGWAPQPYVLASDPLEGSFTYDKAKLEAYYQQHGLSGSPPAELAGLTVKGTMPAGVIAVWGDQATLDQISSELTHFGTPTAGQAEATRIAEATRVAQTNANAHALVLFQSKSPKLEVPGDVDVAKLRDDGLRSGLIPPEIASQLAAIQDWQTTLPIPVQPGTSRDLTIQGVHGVLITEQPHQPKAGESAPASGNPARAIIWQKSGNLYVLGGSVSEAELLAAANSIQ